MGGRSRVAAQMLSAMGFTDVINMAGGIKAWHSNTAVGPEDLGLNLFTGHETPEETLIVAYSLEKGLADFYESMIPKIKEDAARQLFSKLATIEEKHQQRIFTEYRRLTGREQDRQTFEQRAVAPAVEGGLTTEEYLKLYDPDIEVATEVVSLAMAIEAQALDLYQRAAERAATTDGKAALMQIADEERAHLRQLGKLLDA